MNASRNEKRLRTALIMIATAVLASGRQAAAQQEGEAGEGLTQTVKGTIVNVQTRQPIAGVSVAVVGTKLGAISKADGTYRIANVTVGRHTLRLTSVGYEPATAEIVVTSGRQAVMDFELQERAIQGKEVVVSGGDPLKVLNEMALVSADAFSVDDVTRYAGSMGDPARMAQNFAGVLGNDIFRNDIIIRGGSPTELQWRLDGIDVPNPNHFATQGASGGPVNAINANMLANSDFLTGAFPAEFGGRLSGVFDLRTRRGNAEKYEFVAQMGFNGFEGTVEGPIPGLEGGSFIAGYRRSTLQVLGTLGIDIGIDAVPRYQDAMVKLDLPVTTSDNITVTALGGLSDIDVHASALDSVFTGDVDLTNGTDLGVLGVTWQRLFSEKMVGKLTLSTVQSRFHVTIDSLTTDGLNNVTSTDPWSKSRNTEDYIGARYVLSYAPDPSNFFTSGLEGRLLGYNLNQERYTVRTETAPPVILDSGSTEHLFGFVNWNWRPTERITLNTGVHVQHLGVSGRTSVEPRISASYALTPTQAISAGFGVHRQAQPLLVYFKTPENRTLDFTRADHYIVGYTNRPAPDWQWKVEAYYKDISGAPVERDSATSYSLLNSGAGFGSVGAAGNLVNMGTGRNYGAELTVTKHFTDGYYLTLTGSYVRQEYRGSDGILQNGAFDNRYIANALAGYEWNVSPGFTIEFSGKYTISGGAPYTPIDMEKSRLYSATYNDIGRRYTERNPNYSRLDIQTDFRNNFGTWSLIGYVSVQNVLNSRNVDERVYNPRYDRVDTINQVGVFPVGGIRFEF